MKTKQIFALLIRIIGVLGLAHVTRHLVNDLGYGQGNITAMYVVWKLAYLVAGVYLVRGAPQVVEFAYPEESKTPADKE